MEMYIVVELTQTMHTIWYLMRAHNVLYMNKLLWLVFVCQKNLDFVLMYLLHLILPYGTNLVQFALFERSFEMLYINSLPWDNFLAPNASIMHMK